MLKTNLHERLEFSDQIPASSDRAFGFVFTVVFAGAALWLILFTTVAWAMEGAFLLGIAAILFFVTALFYPHLLRGPNKAWQAVGYCLNSVVSPLVMGLVWLTVVTPTGVIRRMAGKDSMARALDPSAESYWIRRDPPGPAPVTLKDQF